jgi:hypothetical protein
MEEKIISKVYHNGWVAILVEHVAPTISIFIVTCYPEGDPYARHVLHFHHQDKAQRYINNLLKLERVGLFQLVKTCLKKFIKCF